MRNGLVVGLVVALLAGCGGGMTLTEYAETIEAELETMNGAIEALDDEMDGVAPTADALRSYYARRIATRDEFMVVLRSLDPPRDARDLHELAVGLVDELTAAEKAFAARLEEAETMDQVAELLAGPEALAMQAVDDQAAALCAEAQGSFDETADREVLSTTNWIPPSLKEVVDVTFRCSAEQP